MTQPGSSSNTPARADAGDDFVGRLGALALTLRMRRLAERLSESGRRFYTTSETPLEPSWYATLLLLHEHEPLGVMEVAARLGVRHPTVIKTAQALQQAGLVIAAPDPTDRRRRMLSLSDEARVRMPEFQTIWDAFTIELEGLLDECGADLIAAMEGMERALDTRALDVRVRERLRADTDEHTAPPRRRAQPLTPTLRVAEEGDRAAILAIARELVRSADTYAYDPDVDDETLWRYWTPHLASEPGVSHVAVHEGAVVGVFVIRPNHAGPGAHVANASYAVRADVRGLGLGRALGESSLEIARALGFRAMQFNIVISTNTRAIRLWRALGFRIIGTVPEGFCTPDGRLVDHHIMYRSLV